MANLAPIGLPPGGAFFSPASDRAPAMITLPNGMQIPVGALEPAAQALIDPRMKRMSDARKKLEGAKDESGRYDIEAADEALSAFGTDLADYVGTAQQRARPPRPMTQAEMLQAQIRSRDLPMNDIGMVPEGMGPSSAAPASAQDPVPTVLDQIQARGVNTAPVAGPRTTPMSMGEQIQAVQRERAQPMMNDIGVMSEIEAQPGPPVTVADQLRARGVAIDPPMTETSVTAEAELPGMDIIDQWAAVEQGPIQSDIGMVPPGMGSRQAPPAPKKVSVLAPGDRKVTQASPARPAGQPATETVVDDSFAYTTSERTPQAAGSGAPTGRLTADQMFEKAMSYARGTPEDKAKLEKEKFNDRSMGLLMAGLGTMGAASKPGGTAFGSLAEGAAGGLNYYRGERKDRAARELAGQKLRMDAGKMYIDLVGKEAELLQRIESGNLDRAQKAEDARELRAVRREMNDADNARALEIARMTAGANGGAGADPAEVKTANWLIANGVAGSPDQAWDMVRRAKSNPVDLVKDIYVALSKSNAEAVALGQKPLTDAELITKAKAAARELANSDAPGGGQNAPDPGDPLGLRKK